MHTSAALLITALLSRSPLVIGLANLDFPPNAQLILPSSFAVLDKVQPASVKNGSTPLLPPGTTQQSLLARPFHIYNEDFLKIIGNSPSSKLIATDSTLAFHEAAVWIPETDEVFFAQNAGAPGSGTGLNKSNAVYKVSLKQAASLTEGQSVNVSLVDIQPPLEMTNGGTNYRGGLIFTNQGRGADIPSNIAIVNAYPPYNSTIILNNYFGRQFNSLNDISINPRNNDIYFTDTTYGFNQNFKPAPGLPQQVYRLSTCTGAVTVVADGFTKSNGVTFSPDGKFAYISDTGVGDGLFAPDYTRPATVYSFEVSDDGTWGSRKVFAYIDTGLPDGVHCDSEGNVYVGVGDGIAVYNPSGTLLGKIWHGSTTANFAFAGEGRIIMLAEKELYYVTLAAKGAPLVQGYSDCSN